jgi:hypothetical protein
LLWDVIEAGKSQGLNSRRGCKQVVSQTSALRRSHIPSPQQISWKPRRLRIEKGRQAEHHGEEPTARISTTLDLLRGVNICASQCPKTGHLIIINPKKLGMCYQVRTLLAPQRKRDLGGICWMDDIENDIDGVGIVQEDVFDDNLVVKWLTIFLVD